jgi:hypothetical protein
MPLNLIVFFAAAFSKYEFFLLGSRMSLGEIIAISSIPFFMDKRIARYLLLMIYPFLIWALGICVSDSINNINLVYFLKGIMKPIFSVLWALFFMNIFMKNHKVMIFFIAGFCLSGLQNYLFPSAWTEYYSDTDYAASSYGLAPLLMAIFVFFATVAHTYLKKFPSYLIMAVCGIFFALLGLPRNIPLVFFLVSAALYAYDNKNLAFLRWLDLKNIKIRKLFLVTFLVTGIFIIIYYTYILMASLGYLGVSQLEKYETQSSFTIYGNTPIGLLLSGRTEVFGAILAIIDNPIIGYGSWEGVSGRLSNFYLEAIHLVGANADILNRMTIYGLHGAVGHSIFFTAWMENGIITAIAFLILFIRILKGILWSYNLDVRFHQPWLFYTFTFLLWHFFFSPFAFSSRMTFGLVSCIFIVRKFNLNLSNSR